jgi:tetratricopeptide (TPR) repeat protein
MKMFSSIYNRFRNPNLSIIILAILLLLPFTHIPSTAQEREGLSDFLTALNNYNTGNFDKALPLLLEITREEKDNDAAPYYAASIYMMQGKIEEAEKYMQKAVGRDPSNKWYKSRYASILLHLGKNSEAEELYKSLLAQHPAEGDLYDNLIDLYIREKEYDKALSVLEDIEQQIGETEGTVITRYNLLRQLGRGNEAADYLIEVHNNNGSPAISTLIADHYASQQKDSLAAEYYQTALTTAPGYIPAGFGLAEIYRIQGKYDLYFKRMFSFMANPAASPAMKKDYMDQIFENRRFIQTFLPQIDTIMQNMYNAHPADSSIAYSYAVFMVQTGKNDRAKEVLEKNLDHYSESREAHRQYLSLLYYMEQWEDLEEKSTRSLEFFPQDPDILQFRGIAQMQMGEYTRAVESFEAILDLSQNDSTLTVNTLSALADIHYQAGNKKEAFRFYRKTIRKAPDHIPALNNYAYYLSLEGKKLKKALEMSKKTIEAEPRNSTYLDTYGWILHLKGDHRQAKEILKKALIYGGKESRDILEHYAEVLHTLEEYELAQIYRQQAQELKSK